MSSKNLKLGFGLKVARKDAGSTAGSRGTQSSQPGPGLKKSVVKAFDYDSSEDEDEAKRKEKIQREIRMAQQHQAEKAKRQYEQAVQSNPNVFDYDQVYDSMKHHEKAKKLAEAEKKEAKYISDLLAASERRKLEQMRVEERKIQREREAEAEMYGDKEMFVTEAYKKKQEELRRLEEEERKKELMEAGARDMTGFYRNILDKRSGIVEDVTTLEGKDLVLEGEGKDQKHIQEEASRQDVQASKQAIQSGRVQLNDSEEVIDKRQLLSAGLNVSNKTKVSQQTRLASIHEQQESKRRQEEEERERKRKEREQAERYRKYIAEQTKKREEEEKRKREEEERVLKEKMARKATESDISDARRRYLERKKQRVESDDDD